MSGSALEDLAVYRGLTRQAPSRSSVKCAFVTEDVDISHTLSAGAQVRKAGEATTFLLTSDVVIEKGSVIHCRYAVEEAVAGNAYILTFVDLLTSLVHSVSYTATASDTVSTIADVLRFKLGEIETVFAESVDAATTQFYPVDSRAIFNITENVNIVLKEIGAAGTCLCIDQGDIVASSGTVTEKVSGGGAWWTRVYNPWDGTIGRGEETDSELRRRIFKSFSSSAAGTLDAIRNAVLSVTGVTLCIVVENATGVVSGDVPPHGIAVLVEAQAGVEQGVAEAIFRSKPAGIATCGEISRNCVDSFGGTHAIRYGAPVIKNVSVAITISKANPDVSFPLGWQETIKEAVVEIGNAYGLGVDIPVQAFFSAVYSVRGAGEATVTVTKDGKTYREMPVVGTDGTVVFVAKNERTSFAIDRVTVAMG
jgi:uncharacterized phage protein gp47/JayE